MFFFKLKGLAWAQTQIQSRSLGSKHLTKLGLQHAQALRHLQASFQYAALFNLNNWKMQK